MQYTCKYLSPAGGITIASDGDSLTGLWFDGQKYFADTLSAEHEEKSLPVFVRTKEWLDCYFGGKEPGFTPDLHLDSTPFRLAVWEILREIPYGKVITYKDIAEEIARQKGVRNMSAQAVGGAVGHNPISIIIPCHRVVGCNGSLTGYAGGIAKKVHLLTLEGVDPGRFFVPSKGTAL
ncbi:MULTISPECIES: methylated-DNA--[protein]-cysteine S-methyltransferase [Butyricimonas]|uniref:methylated-DNA--[protein]-cysteine S-methyltransferase n=1 Tax=Butyricimonas TaxID=574697 RepID=UPI001D086771|nr:MULTISPECIES: methylated-DNA--[protein]-cysteine S-methyltransferase [Butyricimonas]MCB6972230.1 methylated-DNA--[protein]-cysteine S-methyltransferase [Butyricimonas synergistica]MCG4519207.1 methylated-DNA--[protein]-cysteine S-methyltransferase [Butyricimonas sp. DFI.6.44]